MGNSITQETTDTTFFMLEDWIFFVLYLEECSISQLFQISVSSFIGHMETLTSLYLLYMMELFYSSNKVLLYLMEQFYSAFFAMLT